MRLDRKCKILVANSAAVLACLVAMYLMIRPLVQTARDSAMMDSCLSSLHDLGQATNLYLAENDDRYPPANRWMDAVGHVFQERKQSAFRCPEVARDGKASQFGYAFNRPIGGRIGNTVDDPQTPLIFDSSDLSFNANGTFDLLPKPRRHMGNCVLRTDLSVIKASIESADM